MESTTFFESFVYHLVLFIYLLICIGVTTMNYDGKLIYHIILGTIIPFAILIFSPLLQGLTDSDEFVSISLATICADYFALYYTHKKFKNPES